MSKIACTNTVGILSRYMTAMAVVVAPDTASVASSGTDDQPKTEDVCMDQNTEENCL
jgi:hypothetical protein